jgi:hypothetical protein
MPKKIRKLTYLIGNHFVLAIDTCGSDTTMQFNIIIRKTNKKHTKIRFR